MSNELLRQILKNEYSLLNLFTEKIITDDYIRFHDDQIKDMYDHNFTELYGDLTAEIFADIKRFKEERKEPHIKIVAQQKLKVLSILGYEHDILLTMAATSVNTRPLKISGVEFKNLRNNPNLVNDFLDLDVRYYGKAYGEDFIARRMYRYFNKSLDGDGLDYFGCYINNKLVASCYTYYSDGVVGIDGLLVAEEYRGNNLASNLIKYIQQYYQNCPIYLHAAQSESAKDLYTKLGFETIYQKHEYLKLDDE